jgi:predicted MFS family arabinose efflux permease
MSQNEAGHSTGYVELLRKNRDFRNLWVGRVVSQTGDWFNSVALFTLLLSLTGSGESVGYILILKLLPHFFLGPIAGVIADRFNRKAIMIATDLLRGASVFGFLFIESAEQVWIAYAIVAFQVVMTTLFEPAESAAVPTIVSRDELLSANALSGATWSVTLALGAALGGLVTDALGRDAAFIIDALTFFVSAAFIAMARVPYTERPERERAGRLTIAEATGVNDMIEGAQFLKARPQVAALLMIKSGWGLGGGVLLLLTIFGKEIFPVGRDGSTSIGMFYAARGTGALIGPVLARWITHGSPATMRRAITFAFFLSAIFYVLFAQAPNLFIALGCVLGAHAVGSIQWVFSTTLLQMEVPNRFLGRVFALDMAFVTLTMSISTYLTGYGLDTAALSARLIAAILGGAFLIPGLLWLVLQPWLDRAASKAALAEVRAAEAAPATETSFPPA